MLIAVNERGYRIGQGHHHCKITDAEVELIRKLREGDNPMSYRNIAKKFEISASGVHAIANYNRRGHTVTRWKQVDD